MEFNELDRRYELVYAALVKRPQWEIYKTNHALLIQVRVDGHDYWASLPMDLNMFALYKRSPTVYRQAWTKAVKNMDDILDFLGVPA